MASSDSYSIDFSKAMISQDVALLDYSVALPVIVPILMGAVCLIFRKKAVFQAWITALSFLAMMMINSALLVRVIEQGALTMTMGKWLPPFGISFSVDILGALFAFTTSLIGFTITLYVQNKDHHRETLYGFYTFLLFLSAGVSGAFLTGDLFNLYVWFEVLLISSFGLMVLGGKPVQLDGAIKYAFLNLIATTLFLIAVGYLYGIVGTLNMADIAIKIRTLETGTPIMTIGTLFMLGFAMKAAAFPVNFWLPASYHTPSIAVSAIFAGLLTKVGVYAFIRVLLMLMPSQGDILSPVAVWIGALTALFAGFGAIAQSDIRKTLGYLVISGIGIMFIGIGMGSEEGLTSAISYAIHSMIVMTAIYSAFGLAAEHAGGYDMKSAHGVYQSNTLLAAIVLVLIFAVAGFPPFSGFWPKVLLTYETLSKGAGWATFALLFSSFLSLIALGRVWIHVFWKPADGKGASLKVSIKNKTLTYSALFILTSFVVLLGFGGEGLLYLAKKSAQGLIEPSLYLNSVFGE